MNGKDLSKLKEYMDGKEGHIDEIMETLSLAGFDDKVIDYLSDGLWSKKQKLIGLDITELITYGKVNAADMSSGHITKK